MSFFNWEQLQLLNHGSRFEESRWKPENIKLLRIHLSQLYLASDFFKISLLICQQLSVPFRGRFGGFLWGSQNTQFPSFHQPQSWTVSDLSKMNLLTYEMIQTKQWSKSGPTRWSSQKTQLFKIYQSELRWVSDFCKISFVDLHANSCYFFTDQGLKDFGKGLGTLGSLTLINLEFSGEVTFVN